MRTRVTGYGAVLLAALFLAWAVWPRLGNGSGAAGATAFDTERDRVAAIATRQLAALNSMDVTKVGQQLTWWLDASTGELHEELKRGNPAQQPRIQRARTDAEGTVTALAVTALDTRAGTASVLASITVRLTAPDKSVTEQRKRYQADLRRTPTGWKIRLLTAIGGVR